MVCWVLPHSLLPLVFSPTFINIQDAFLMHSESQWSFYLDKASICQHPLSLGRGVTTGAVKAVPQVTRSVDRLSVVTNVTNVTTDTVMTRRVVTVVR